VWLLEENLDMSLISMSQNGEEKDYVIQNVSKLILSIWKIIIDGI
jgi:hypothetical protein